MKTTSFVVELGKRDAKKTGSATVKLPGSYQEATTFDDLVAYGQANPAMQEAIVTAYNYGAILKARAKVVQSASEGVTDEQRSEALGWAVKNDVDGMVAAQKQGTKAWKEYLNRIWDEQFEQVSV